MNYKEKSIEEYENNLLLINEEFTNVKNDITPISSFAAIKRLNYSNWLIQKELDFLL